ncbi:MAG: type II toxin-antitoxin system VapC family toxin [Acidobacteriota bacterium]
MRLLLDTHIFLWWLDGDAALSAAAQTAIADEASEVLVSAVSAWEIATKFRLGKLPGAAAVAVDVAGAAASQGFPELPIALRHGEKAGALPGPHRDPFDRMLIAQAMLEDLVIVSNDEAFDAYGVRRLW